MAAYRHGVFIDEVPTSLVTPVQVDAALPVIVGTAPVHNLKQGTAQPVNQPALIFDFPQFVREFGAPAENENSHDFTLYEAAQVYLGRYGVAPIVVVNVFDPAIHVDDENKPDVSTVTAAQIIGGVDAATGKRTGLQLVHEVFPRFRLVPAQILAPKYSGLPEVAIAIDGLCQNISGHFRAVGLVEIPHTVTTMADAPAWLNTNNLTSANLIALFGTAQYGTDLEYGSIHLAAVIAKRDSENEGIPFWSPSNHRMLCNGMVHAGQPLHLTPQEASYLNGQGIVTGLNMTGGLVIWGDQMSCYPGITDVRESSIPIRRMFNFIGNTLVLTAWQFVSSPLRRRMVETVCDTFNVWLNGLTAREYILGGRVTFEMADNPTTDLMGGIARFHVYVTPPNAAHELVFILEYDPAYLATLFGMEAGV